jgi:uroporphyrinogen decarboxylase
VLSFLGFEGEEKLQPNWGTVVRSSRQVMDELSLDLQYIHLNPSTDAPRFEYGVESYTDEWGVGYQKIENPTGIYYEICKHPLAAATIHDLDYFDWPDPRDPSRTAGLLERCLDLYKNTDRALVGKFSTPIFEQAWYLRGYEQWLQDLIVNKEFACALLDRLTDIAVELSEVGLEITAKYLQIYRVAGDDLGHQEAPLISPKMFRELVKPRFARLYEAIKSLLSETNPSCKLKAHSDGDIYPLIEDFIDIGLDVLNPVQPYVAEMDHGRIKNQYGSQLSFHGGIDIQRILPFGTPAEVKKEAIKTMQTLGSGGGYILAPTHYVQADVPAENIIALRDAVLEFGRYPLTHVP